MGAAADLVDGGVSRLGVLRNPESRRNRRRAAPAPADALIIEPDSPAAVVEALAVFRDAGVDLLAVDGGDGTVREVVSALPQVWPDAPPPLAVLASGRTNVIARDVGVRGPRRTALTRLAMLYRLQMLRTKRRSPLEVSAGDGRAAVRGFCFGAAAYRRATELALGRGARGAEGAAAVGLTVTAALLEALVAPRSGWRAGEPMGVAVDGAEPQAGARFLLFATTLHRLPLAQGLAAFEGGGMAVLDVLAPPRRLVVAAGALIGGGSAPWLEAEGYRRGVGRRLNVALTEPYVLDGETFPGGELVVQVAPALTFVTP